MNRIKRKLRIYRVTVVYKSGAVVRFRCRGITVTHHRGQITSVEWDGPKPRPLVIGVDEIAAVYLR